MLVFSEHKTSHFSTYAFLRKKSNSETVSPSLTNRRRFPGLKFSSRGGEIEAFDGSPSLYFLLTTPVTEQKPSGPLSFLH